MTVNRFFALYTTCISVKFYWQRFRVAIKERNYFYTAIGFGLLGLTMG